jgi:hypothetical protein
VRYEDRHNAWIARLAEHNSEVSRDVAAWRDLLASRTQSGFDRLGIPWTVAERAFTEFVEEPTALPSAVEWEQVPVDH